MGKSKRKLPEGWIGIPEAAKLLQTDAPTLYSRRDTGVLNKLWNKQMFQAVADASVHGGMRYIVHEARLKEWMAKKPAGVKALQRQRRPRKVTQAKPSKKQAGKTPRKKAQKGGQLAQPSLPSPPTQHKGVHVTRQDCMNAMRAILAPPQARLDASPQKLGSLFYDAVQVYTAACCTDAAKQMLTDEKFKHFYAQSKFCPLCGTKLR